MRRLRIAQVMVQPILVWDDGDELTPGPQTQPIAVPLAELATLAERLRADMVTLEAAQSAPAPPAMPSPNGR